MRIDTFFEKFDQLADAPNTLENIRTVILRLAVHGWLSEANTTDAPVVDLIQRLSEAKASRSSSRTTRNGRELPANDSQGRPFQTPKHWAWVPLNEIGVLSGGMTPSKAKSSYWDGDVNWFSPKDIKSDELVDSELKITSEGVQATGLQLYPPGCLFMVARSGILKRTFPVSINRVEATANQDLKVLTPFVVGLECYLQIMFLGMTDFILSSLVKTGTTVQSLKYEEFEVQPFPLPPLAEQKRIVAKVGELMALCDRLEAQLLERDTRHAALARASLARFSDAPTPANLNLLFHDSYTIAPADLRKTILSLAVHGKLVSQVPSDETTDELLSRIESRKQELRRAGLTNTTSVAAQQTDLCAPFPIPATWGWVRLGQVSAYIQRGKTPVYASDEGSPVVSQKCVRWSGVDLEPARLVTNESLERYEKVRFLQDGDLLWNSTGTGTIGRVARVVSPPPRLVCDSHVTVVRSLEVEPEYIRTWLRSEFVYGTIEERASGSTNQIELTTQMAVDQLVPLPPFAEQRRIVAVVDQLMVLVDRLEAQLAAGKATATSLVNAMVAELTAET